MKILAIGIMLIFCFSLNAKDGLGKHFSEPEHKIFLYAATTSPEMKGNRNPVQKFQDKFRDHNEQYFSSRSQITYWSQQLNKQDIWLKLNNAEENNQIDHLENEISNIIKDSNIIDKKENQLFILRKNLIETRLKSLGDDDTEIRKDAHNLLEKVTERFEHWNRYRKWHHRWRLWQEWLLFDENLLVDPIQLAAKELEQAILEHYDTYKEVIDNHIDDLVVNWDQIVSGEDRPLSFKRKKKDKIDDKIGIVEQVNLDEINDISNFLADQEFENQCDELLENPIRAMLLKYFKDVIKTGVMKQRFLKIEFELKFIRLKNKIDLKNETSKKITLKEMNKNINLSETNLKNTNNKKKILSQSYNFFKVLLRKGSQQLNLSKIRHTQSLIPKKI